METFRTPSIIMKENQICSECMSKIKLNNKFQFNKKDNDKQVVTKTQINKKSDSEYITSDELYVSKAQAKLIRNICYAINNNSAIDFLTFKKQLKLSGLDHLSEWMSLENFFELMIDRKPNQISLIFEFEKLKRTIGETPTKDQIQQNSRFKIKEYENQFKTWADFLERLGYDPWYRKPKDSQVQNFNLANTISQDEYERKIIAQKLLDDIILNSSTNDEIFQKISNHLNEKLANNELLKIRLKDLLEYINPIPSEKIQNITETLE